MKFVMFKVILLFLMVCPVLRAGEPTTWKNAFQGGQKSPFGLVVVQTIGSVSMGEKRGQAILYLAGVPKRKKFSMGIYLGDLNKEWRGVPWDDYRGPDLSEYTLHETPLEIVLQTKGREIKSKFRILVTGVLLPYDNVGYMAEAVNIDSGEWLHRGCSLKEVFEAMVGGGSKLKMYLKVEKYDKTLEFDFSDGSHDSVLSGFLEAIYGSK